MSNRFPSLSHIPLQPGSTCARPPELPPLVHLDSPALEVMTDFEHVWAVTTSAEIGIDDALETMKTKGVRLLLVTDEHHAIIGLVTANDIQGEKPIKLAQASGLRRSQITVAQIMTPQADIEALNFISVRNAQVGHIVATLHALERQHALVVEVDEAAGSHKVRGLFSTSQISKQVGHDVSETMTAAHSLAEIRRGAGGGEEGLSAG